MADRRVRTEEVNKAITRDKRRTDARSGKTDISADAALTAGFRKDGADEAKIRRWIAAGSDG